MKDIKYNKISNKLESGFLGFWVKNRRVSFLVMGLIAIMGVLFMITIPKESSPEINLGIVAITTVYQGATPQDIDNLVTTKIEKEIKDIDGINKISSTSNNGFASTIVEFQNDTDMMQALMDINDAVDKVDLPSDAEDPRVQDISTNNEMMFSILIYGDQEKYSPYYIKEKGRILKKNIEGQGGINKIDFDMALDTAGMGITTNNGADAFYEIEVLLDKQKVQDLGLNIIQISQIIRDRNSNQPLGNGTIGDLGYSFRIEGEIHTIEELGDLPIQTSQGYVTLKDISSIYKILKTDTIQKAGNYGLSGQNYVSLVFNKENGESIFAAASSAKAILKEEFKKTEYNGLSYVITFDLSEIIIQDYNDLAKNGIQTLLLVFFALLIFVGFKESLIATITLPLAFFITFIFLDKMGMSLNFLTNFSLIVTFGIAIDTTIVIVEGAHEKMRQGFNPKNAVLLAVKEYKNVLIAGTSTTLVVFLPLLTLPGMMGKFLSYIPITIFITLAAALFISLTLNSALYYKLSKKGKYFNSDFSNTDFMSEEDTILLMEDRRGKIEKPEHIKNKRDVLSDKLAMWYYEKLGKFIENPKNRILSIVLPVAALILSFIVISPNLGFTLVPSKDSGYLSLSIEGPNGSNKEYMSQYSNELENILSQQEEIKIYYTSIAGDTINTSIELWEEKIRKKKNLKTITEFEVGLDSALKYFSSQGLKNTITVSQDGPPSSQPIGIKLTADNTNQLDALKKVALDFEQHLAIQNGIKNIQLSSQESPGQFVYQFDKVKMTLLGLTPNNFKFNAFAVSNGMSAGTIKGPYDDNEIKLIYDINKNNITPQSLDESNMLTPAGVINFGNITDYSFNKALTSISREDNKIMINISADTENGIKPDDIQAGLKTFAETYQYPNGISYYMGGEAEDNMELIQSVMISFAIAVMFIFLILVLQFNSYTQPTIILYSVLVGLLGGNIGLWLVGEPYSMMFGIGFIALTGIIVNDSIVLLDRINKNLERGMKKKESITEAGKSRLQPIILTTITTFFGLMSIVGDAMWKSLAITIMIGIIFGSAATLFVIPNLYYDKDKLKGIFNRTLLKYAIYLLIPIIITGIVITILMILGIPTIDLFGQLLLAIFMGFNVWYSFYTIHARTHSGQTVIQKLLGIKVLNKNKKIMTVAQARKRFFIGLASLLGPAIVGIILSLLIGLLSKDIGSMIGMGVATILYLAMIYKSLLLIWTKDNTSLTDQLSDTITVASKR